MAPILRYLCLKTVQIKRRSVKKFPLCINRVMLKNAPTDVSVELQEVRVYGCGNLKSYKT